VGKLFDINLVKFDRKNSFMLSRSLSEDATAIYGPQQRQAYLRSVVLHSAKTVNKHLEISFSGAVY
jgi:hypothetical protein